MEPCKILPARRDGRNRFSARHLGGRDRALDEAAAEHARLALAGVIEHAGLAGRHAMFAIDKFHFVAGGAVAQPGRLRRPGRTHLDEHFQLVVGKLRIEGDAELARRLQKLAQAFDPDWDLPFMQVFGDVLGVQIAKAVKAALRQAQVVGANLAGTAAEYLTEESRDVVPRAELEAFHDDVDTLRDDVERIAAKVARLRRNVFDQRSGSAA